MEQMNMNTNTTATSGAATVGSETGRVVGRYHAQYFEDGELVWELEYDNLVTDVGAKDMLDKYLAGSGYTGTFYLGLISSVSYSAVAYTDTMSSHSGWTEAGSANAPTYSQSARPTAAWSAAGGTSGSGNRSKALSSSATFSFTGSGTVKGSFLSTSSTKDGTSGTLFSAGTFSGGDQVVSPGGTLQVSYTLSL